MLDLAAGHGRDLDEAPGRLRRSGQADEQDAAQRVRQALASVAVRVRGRDELLGEERVAVRSPGDRIDERRGGRRAGDAGQQLDELGALEPREVEAFDPRLALGLGQPGGQRVAAVQLVRPEGARR